MKKHIHEFELKNINMSINYCLPWEDTKLSRSRNKCDSTTTINYDRHVKSICKFRFKLTRREIDCYLLMADGYRAKEIGRLLYISYRTVEKHVENIKRKLDCKSIASIGKKINQYIFEEIV